ncbi:MAG: DEAD/DEAH box helicase, partial [Clostridiaceae bacterium]|nr:DEAD/DEAH box helicase [Clostridiaceae bacterium]
MDIIANECVVDNIVFFNIKTTGADQYRNEIIEISAIKIKDNKITKYNTLVKPMNRVPGYIYESYPYITEENLNKAPYINEVEEELLNFLENFPVICHNGGLESGFIFEYIKGFRNDILDLMEFSAILEPWQKEFRLESLINQVTINNIDFIASGMDYCNYMMMLFNSLLCRQWDREERSTKRRKTTLYQILTTQYNLSRRWPFTKYLERPLMFSAAKFPYVNFDETKKSTLKLKKISVDYTKYEDLLKDKAIWNNGGDFNYEFRKDQWLFTKKIRENVERDEKIFIEAPTGSGKTFAYVLTAALKAYVNKQKNKVADASFIISTDTKELQNQLIYKDIPSILKKLGLEEKIKYGSIKGKSNYLCVDRLIKAQTFSGDLSSILAEIFLKRLCATGEHGDVENINFWAYKHFSLEKYLPDILCDNDECNIEKCNRTCYLKKRYNDLPLENITVVNHSLLANWPYTEKKKITHLIIDEAHNLMDKCYDFFAEEFYSEEFQELLLNITDKEPTIFRQLASLNASYGYKENIDLDKMKYWIKEIQTSV